MRRVLAVLALSTLCVPERARADDATELARARQLASLLGLERRIESVAEATPPRDLSEALARTSAIDDAIVALSRAQLAIDATRARLLHEEHQARTAHELIQKRYEDSVERWSLAAVLAGSGTAIVGSGMQLGNSTDGRWGDGVAIAGSVVAAAFSIVALAKHNVGVVQGPIESSLLAPLLGCAPAPGSGYPDWIWGYLDQPLAGASQSIRSELLEKWAREGRIPRAGVRGDDARLRHLCQPVGAGRRIDGDLLAQRANMLADVRERLVGVGVDLDLLWRELRARR
jgi:hypothetical protein